MLEYPSLAALPPAILRDNPSNRRKSARIPLRASPDDCARWCVLILLSEAAHRS